MPPEPVGSGGPPLPRTGRYIVGMASYVLGIPITIAAQRSLAGGLAILLALSAAWALIRFARPGRPRGGRGSEASAVIGAVILAGALAVAAWHLNIGSVWRPGLYLVGIGTLIFAILVELRNPPRATASSRPR